MLARVFPRQFDNVYRGQWAALVLLVLIMIFRSIMAYFAAVETLYGAVHADRIPIHSYSPEAANMVLSLFAKLGNASFVPILIGLLALVRYRSMVPLVFLILIYEYVTRRILSVVWDGVSFVQVPTSTPGWVIQSLVVAMFAGFLLSVWHRKGQGA